MSNETSYSRRRSVLKAVSGLAGLQLVGQAYADVSGTTRFAEIGVVHEFETLPDSTVTALPYTPQLHQVGPEEEVRFHPELSIEQMRAESQKGWIVWSDDYHTLPSAIVQSKPRTLIVSELNNHCQPIEAVKLVNKYQPPKVQVHSGKDSIKVRSRGNRATVRPREQKEIDLRSRKVVVDTVDNAGKQPVEMNPAIIVKNHGKIAD